LWWAGKCHLRDGKEEVADRELDLTFREACQRNAKEQVYRPQEGAAGE
jgi:hypothetical protein